MVTVVYGNILAVMYDVCKALSCSPCYCMVRNFVAVFTDVVLATMTSCFLITRAFSGHLLQGNLHHVCCVCVCVIASLIHTIENKYGIPNLRKVLVCGSCPGLELFFVANPCTSTYNVIKCLDLLNP